MPGALDAGVTVKAAVCDDDPIVAVIVTEDDEETTAVVTGKVAVALPSGTVSDAGTNAAAVFEVESVTTAPPVPAAPDNVTLP